MFTSRFIGLGEEYCCVGIRNRCTKNPKSEQGISLQECDMLPVHLYCATADERIALLNAILAAAAVLNRTICAFNEYYKGGKKDVSPFCDLARSFISPIARPGIVYHRIRICDLLGMLSKNLDVNTSSLLK